MTFYEKVLEEYNKNDTFFICESSQTFQKAWNSEFRLQILEHSRLYLESIRKMEQYRKILLETPINEISSPSLFRSTDRKLRVNFLKFCVDNKLDLV